MIALNMAYALVGPPAAGKSLIARELRKYGVAEIVGYTTREPRTGEKDGDEYHFVDKETFARAELIEKVSYSGHFYGLAKNEVLKKVEEHPVCVVSVEMHGLEQLKKLLGQRIASIFVLVDENTIIDRIIQQGGDFAVIQDRINYAKAANEFDNWHTADHVVKNTGAIDVTVRQVMAIMGLVELKT